MEVLRPNPSPARTGAGGLHLGPDSKGRSGSTSGGGLEFVYLREYFGHEDFRPGQHEVVQAIVSGRDTAVFWATGAGKSLCYQLPALQTGKMAIVISPLISLMQDQVNKFNATVGASDGKHRACFLGSAQFDANVEQAVLRAEYRIVYMTPEKATGSFLDRLKKLHADKKLSLLAVDEAHCISEWGHDFRPSYRGLRAVRDALAKLPFMALTATAVPRVQQDIVQQLGFQKDACVSQSSFDRKNLQLACSRKSGKASDLERIAKDLSSKRGSTIVYVPTQNETDSVASFLQDKLAATGISVAAYHGGRAPGEREKAHLDFLSGKAEVIVATVAFGMGIDKPDIRRIIHYGPPKTVEEYFQQVGRAGRDGLTSTCELLSADSDFGNYHAPFYTNGLTEQCKQQMLASVESLRRYVGEPCCRRRWLLEYFGEAPSFGTSCGNCDFCVACSKNTGDTHRNFQPVAAPILLAGACTSSFPVVPTALLQILAGTQPKSGSRAVTEAIPKIQAMLAKLPKFMRSQAFLKEMLSVLSTAGYFSRQRREVQTAGGYVNSFEVYLLSDKGKEAHEKQSEIRLPVPTAVRQQEEKEAQRIAARVKEIKEAGYDPEKMSKDELESNDNKLVWYIRKLKSWRDSGSESSIKRADNHEELKRRVLAWRNEAAVKLHMAPASVFHENLAATISYCKPTNVEDLRSIGVRIAGIEELAKLIAQAKLELFTEEVQQPSEAAASLEGKESPKRAAQLSLPAGPWKAPAKWSGAVYKPGPKKLGGKAVWEISYDRFSKGESLIAIAAVQDSGKPIQPGTVSNHIMTAVTHARPVDLARLAEQSAAIPDQAEWQKLEDTASERACNPKADFARKEFLCAVLGESVNRDFNEKTEAEKEVERKWYNCIDWWAMLKRVDFPVAFGEEQGDAKRQRT